MQTAVKHRILIVESDQVVGESLVKVLLQAGYGTHIAPDVSSATTALRTTHYQSVLLDLDLPDSAGWDLLETFAQLDATLPVVLFTSFLDQCESGILPGKGALLEKPLDPDALLDVLSRQVQPDHPGEPATARHLTPTPAALAGLNASNDRVAAGS